MEVCDSDLVKHTPLLNKHCWLSKQYSHYCSTVHFVYVVSIGSTLYISKAVPDISPKITFLA